MKGLIIKDLMSFRKGLINVIFVSAAVLVFSVMVCISAGSGNLYRMMQENTLKTDEYSFPPMMVLKFIILVLMILPMVSVGDSITYLLREDKRSGFVSVVSATPLTIGKRVLARFISLISLYLLGAAASILISSLITITSGLIPFSEMLLFVVGALSVFLIYTFLLFVIDMVLEGSGVFAQTSAMLLIILGATIANIGNIIELIKAGDGFAPVLIDQVNDMFTALPSKAYIFPLIAIIAGLASYFISVAYAEKKREVI